MAIRSIDEMLKILRDGTNAVSSLIVRVEEQEIEIERLKAELARKETVEVKDSALYSHVLVSGRPPKDDPYDSLTQWQQRRSRLILSTAPRLVDELIWKGLVKVDYSEEQANHSHVRGKLTLKMDVLRED